MGETAIRVQNVSKTFKLPHQKQNSVKGLFVNMFRKNRTFERQQVLHNVSFEVSKGDFFGIVGRNGSGKSTLLKLLAGIYEPDKGSVVVNGRLTPFIELGVGFNPELTGRDNVFLNGALLGFNRREMEAMYGQIVEFAELEKFMDQKLKNYSSGMQVRLAFSIAIRAQSDILLVDEVLAVGDASFQQKCFDTFAELKKKGTTIILVTHDMNSVLRFCDRAMLIHNSQIVMTGRPSAVADEYLELNYENNVPSEDKKDHKEDPRHPKITSVKTRSSQDVLAHTFTPGERVRIEIEFKNPMTQVCHFGLQIFNEAGVYCFGTNTKILELKPSAEPSGVKTLELVLGLLPGSYNVTAALMNSTGTSTLSYRPKAAEFRVRKDSQLEGIALLEHKWI